MKIAKNLALLAGLLASPALLAHDDAYLDTLKAPNGGQLRMAGVYHYELVVAKEGQEARENPVIVYVTGHDGGKVPTAGAGGSAILLAGKLKAQATLKPDGDNRMKGYAKYAATPDLKAVVSIALPGKPAEQARFTPLARASNDH
jgi:hypothetical protein